MDLTSRACVTLFMLSEAFLASPVCLGEVFTANRTGSKPQVVVVPGPNAVDQTQLLVDLQSGARAVRSFLDDAGWQYLARRGVEPDDGLLAALVAMLQSHPVLYAFGASRSKLASSADALCQALQPLRSLPALA